ncbi:MAG: fluoride efflux transporter CrcB [Planctomycetota bacterium]
MTEFAKLFWIALGGSCGAVFRYTIAMMAQSVFKLQFPVGTMLANVLGCLLMGLLIGSGQDQENDFIRFGFGVGFLGSLTTFSTFKGETVRHAMDGNWGIAVANVFLSVVLCLAAVVSGVVFAKRIWS